MVRHFEYSSTCQLAQHMLRLLVSESSLNEYLQRLLPLIAGLFGTSRTILVDYRERSSHFEILYFEGYPGDSVHRLRRRVEEMSVARALTERRPYWSEINHRLLCVPLYFSNILEAVLVLEGKSRIELTPARSEACELAGRFLGMLMSSSRLTVNRDQVVDFEDLQKARQIQLSFLPNERPSNRRWEVYGYNDSSALVGGDYFDFFPAGGGVLHGVLADACGHGMAAALIMSNFRGLLQAEMRRGGSFPEIFNELNNSVHFEADVIHYLTAVLFCFHEGERRFQYLNAGHFDPLLFTGAGEVRTLPGGGPPLGMFKDSLYPLGQTVLNPGDLIALFTDGLADIENGNGEHFGLRRIQQTVREFQASTLERISEEVLSRATSFARGRHLEDDVTLFLFRVRE